jgi:hypothetical protein
MLSSRNFHPAVIATLLWLPLVSCSTQKAETLTTVMPATSSIEITLNERSIPDTCDVFAHLIITVPAGVSASSLKNSIEQYGMENGADFVLIGMTRESSDTPERVTFHPYGPKSPYSFKKRWLGWTFGFSDWNKGGDLVDFGHDRMTGDEPVFDQPVDGQALLLSCAPKK